VIDFARIVVRSKGGVTVTHDRDETDDTQQDEINMPCDALILKGHCVVNEAMLTGESVPQLKETIRSNVELLKKQVSDSDIAGQDNDNNPLSSDSRRHMLYAGTTIMQHTENLSTENQSLKNTVTIPRSPDKGCLCIVMRTGYGSVQVRYVQLVQLYV
jgi:cation-transporting ATPase 13A1